MKILHICQYFQENMRYQENVLPIAHKGIGNCVYIITSDRECVYFSNKKQRIKKVEIKNYNGVTLIRSDIYFELKNKFVVFKGLYRLIKKINPDYIYHYGLTSPSLFTVTKYKKNNPNVVLVCEFHAMYENTMRTTMSIFYHKVIWRNIIKSKIKFIDKIFFIAPECMDFIHEVYKVPKIKLNFLPLGGDISNINNYDYIRKKYRNKLNIKNRELLIIHAGKITPLKKTETLLKSFKFIKEKNIKLIMIGAIENGYKKILTNFINNDNRITYLGWKNPEELSKVFCAGDILIQPGTASVIFEQAICNGLPIVLSKTKLGQYLVSKDNGIVLQKIDEKELSKIINYFNQNRGILKEMHENAINFAQEELSYKVIAKKSIISNKKC